MWKKGGEKWLREGLKPMTWQTACQLSYWVTWQILQLFFQGSDYLECTVELERVSISCWVGKHQHSSYMTSFYSLNCLAPPLQLILPKTDGHPSLPTPSDPHALGATYTIHQRHLHTKKWEWQRTHPTTSPLSVQQVSMEIVTSFCKLWALLLDFFKVSVSAAPIAELQLKFPLKKACRWIN